MSSLGRGWSGFGAGGLSWDFTCGATLVSTRCRGLQDSGVPTWVPTAVAARRRAVVFVSRGGAWLGGEGIVVLTCPPNGVALVGAALWGLGLSLLDG